MAGIQPTPNNMMSSQLFSSNPPGGIPQINPQLLQQAPQPNQATPSIQPQLMSQLGVKQKVATNQTQHQTYKVKKGDTLWGIAQALTGNGNNWKQFEGFHSDPRSLQPGTVISIPRNLVPGQAQPAQAQLPQGMPSFSGGSVGPNATFPQKTPQQMIQPSGGGALA